MCGIIHFLPGVCWQATVPVYPTAIREAVARSAAYVEDCFSGLLHAPLSLSLKLVPVHSR